MTPETAGSYPAKTPSCATCDKHPATIARPQALLIRSKEIGGGRKGSLLSFIRASQPRPKLLLQPKLHHLTKTDPLFVSIINMSSPSEWSDRRGLFQKGKEVHEPGRRLSGGAGGVIDAVRRASTSSTSEKGSFVSNPLSNDPASPASPTSQRRRVRNHHLHMSIEGVTCFC